MTSTFWMKHSRQEIITYLVVWGLLFVAPLLSLYVRTIGDANISFNWTEIFIVWRKFAIYLVLFLVHNFLLAPLLVHRHKRLMYFSFVAVLLGAFAVFQCSSKPEIPSAPRPNEMPRPDFPEPHDRPEIRDGRPPKRPNDHHPRRPAEFRPTDAPPPIIGERDIMAVLVLILMFGANLGIKVYFRSRDDRRRLAELEKKSLEQQLEYLRYQINPHFFMNTLNNIHALVDIDPAKAQETIVELSKMMRFVLYEGDKSGVPLKKEMEFICTYVKLMQLRYTDKVRITLDLPTAVPDRTIPPLVLISFVENAFKHGISYQHESFIEVTVAVLNERLLFTCRNSKPVTAHDGERQEGTGGVGLANVCKRLDLLYGNNYGLSIDNATDTFAVDLDIPLTF